MDAPAVPTVTELLLAQAENDGPGLLFEDRRWSWREHIAECARYAAALRDRRSPDRPFHVGVLAENVPEFSFLLGGCALAGAVLVALNPVRRGAALAADVARTDCQYVLTEPRYADLLPPLDVPVLPLGALDLPARASPDPGPTAGDGLLMLIFTSGTNGFCYFAGRAGDWLRVDGENLGTAPIERALRRHPAVAEAAVYGVPDPVAGDQVMACLTLRSGATLTPDGFGEFLAAQRDLGPRQHPRFVRIAAELPRTPTFKVLTRVLAADRWHTADPVWWRPSGTGGYVALGAAAAAALDAANTPGTAGTPD